MYLVYGSLEPILSLRLEDYDVTDTVYGQIFGIQPLFYMLGVFIVPYIVPKWVEHRVTLISGLSLLSFATILVGPFY